MTVKNLYTVRPGELEIGDILMCTAVCYLDQLADGSWLVKVYHGKFPTDETIPQGGKIADIYSEDSEGFELLKLLFPVVTWAMEHRSEISEKE